MRRTFIALVCLVALLFAAGLPSVSGADYSGIYCIAVNDKFLRDFVAADTMPFPSGGQLYVPYTVFDGAVTGEPFGIYNLPNSATDTLTLSTLQKALTFYVSGGYSQDNFGNQYSDRVISRNGRMFVPVNFVCTFFGLDYSYLITETTGGLVPILRISNSRRWLDDKQFAGAAGSAVADRVVAYYRSLTPTPSPSPSPSVTPVPSPDPSPSPPPTATTTEPIDKRDVRVSFAFEVTEDTAGLDELLTALAPRRLSALFLFPPDRLAELDDTVRRVLGGGHRVGLLLGPDSAEDFSAARRLLTHIARIEPRIVSLPSGASANADWILWRGNIDGRVGASATRATAILTAAANRTEANITMDCTAQSAGALSRVLRGLDEENYTLRSVTETSLYAQ